MAKKVETKTNLHLQGLPARTGLPREKTIKGEFFMCKCDFQKRSMFLNRDYCDNFKKK